MKAPLRFDPEDYDYGPATRSIRRILVEWGAIDWCEPPRVDTRERATRLFEEHNFLARMHMPDVFPERVEVSTARGGWAEFHALCQRVTAPRATWDWKFSALKKLAAAHLRARGWDRLREVPPLPPGSKPRPGDLFWRIHEEAVVWNALQTPADLRLLPSSARHDAAFYLGYVLGDAMECVEWQLAARTDDLDGNPFVPLLRCYAAGHYPFSLGPSEVILFAFGHGGG